MEVIENKQAERVKASMPKPKQKYRRIVRKLIILFLILAILTGAGWYLYSSLKAQYTVTYQPYTASIGTISNSLSFNGTLQAVYSTSYTANSSGTVKAVYFPAGTQVQKGDRLMRLSTGQLIEAEFDGEVDVVNYAVGDTVSAGDTLCQVVDFTHMKTSIRVDEYDINRVHVGDAIRVTTTANEKVFDSTVSAINHTSSSSGTVAYYTATAYVDVDGEVFPGMQVTVTLPQEEAGNVVILKMDAISFDEENSAFVYTMDSTGKMQKTYITTGVSNGSYAEIKTGLRDGDTVYAEVKAETSNTVTNLFGSLFRQTQVMGNMPGSQGGSRNRDSSFAPGNMPDFGGGPGRLDSMAGGGFGGGNQ